MKRVKIIVSAVLLAVCWIGLQPAAANDLEGISVARQGDSIAVAITTSADCQYDVFLADSKPERIVIDLGGVVNNLPKKQFAHLPLNSIKSIRTSQFKSAPDPQARVVLDIHRPVQFTSFRDGNDVIVKIAIVPDELASINWSSTGSTATVVSAPPVEKAPVEETQVEAPVEVAETAPAPEVKAVEKPAEIPAEKPAETVVQTPVTPITEEKPVEEKLVEEKPIQVAPPQKVENNPPAPQQSAVASPMSPGVEVDTSPKRKMVEYNSEDEKDPFVSLVGISTGKISDGIPSLENLKLVGILEDNQTSSALLEDGEGNGYILKPNDRIQNGYLLNVSDTKATFQITEYGWTRTVALELQIPEIK